MVPTLPDLCVPWAEMPAGTAGDGDFAAGLARVIRGAGGPAEHGDPTNFFASTSPVRGLHARLRNACGRIRGRDGAVSAIFRLDTSCLIPRERSRIAAFDGENADPARTGTTAELPGGAPDKLAIRTVGPRDEFRRDPAWPMRTAGGLFTKGARTGEYVHRRDALPSRQGDASASLKG